jgi:hypothetical protein
LRHALHTLIFRQETLLLGANTTCGCAGHTQDELAMCACRQGTQIVVKETTKQTCLNESCRKQTFPYGRRREAHACAHPSLARQRGQATAHTRRRVLCALRGIDTVNQGLSVWCRTGRQKSVKTRNFMYTCRSGNFANEKKNLSANQT